MYIVQCILYSVHTVHLIVYNLHILIKKTIDHVLRTDKNFVHKKGTYII